MFCDFCPVNKKNYKFITMGKIREQRSAFGKHKKEILLLLSVSYDSGLLIQLLFVNNIICAAHYFCETFKSEFDVLF